MPTAACKKAKRAQEEHGPSLGWITVFQEMEPVVSVTVHKAIRCRLEKPCATDDNDQYSICKTHRQTVHIQKCCKAQLHACTMPVLLSVLL